MCKRCIDVTLAALGLLLLSPLLLLIAIAIKLDTPGPVLFTQPRAGSYAQRQNRRMVWKTRTFVMLKFRSMYYNADQTTHEEQARAYVRGGNQLPNTDQATSKLANDSRVTRVGAVIRATSLDELPQLWNVLRGEMSLIGPRPVPLYEDAEYEDWHRERLATLPGITGLWQVKGRCLNSFDEQIRLDIEYVRTQSLGLDLHLLLCTLPAILSKRGAG